MVKVVLEPSPQLQRSGSEKVIEQQSKARGRKINQDQLLGEGDYATIERQVVCDNYTLDLCHAAAWNA